MLIDWTGSRFAVIIGTIVELFGNQWRGLSVYKGKGPKGPIGRGAAPKGVINHEQSR